MKKYILTLLFLPLLSVSQGIHYQAVARDVTNSVLINQTIDVKFSIISDITTSAISWQEIHYITTNNYGLFNSVIGQGVNTNVGSSATFSLIDWGASNHLLKVEIDLGGGYIDMGTTAFMSVPYAFTSTNAGATGSQGIQGIQGVQGATGLQGVAGQNGLHGLHGVTGPQGLTGIQGPQGVAGINQNLSVSGDTLFISGGNYVVISGLSDIN
tara:strand:- start:18 stop:653 length:636 start_codon:yes stop_codon:yes gene_type:complete